MSETKSVHDVAAMVGIDRKTSEEILAQVRANQSKLNSCPGHDFSICVDRYSGQPLADPTDKQLFEAMALYSMMWRGYALLRQCSVRPGVAMARHGVATATPGRRSNGKAGYCVAMA